jgi:tetratricopeptide (TPR) repeat protein
VRQLTVVLKAGDPGAAMFQMRDTVETLVKFATLVIASDILQKGSSKEIKATQLHLFDGRLSLGGWTRNLNQFAKISADNPIRFSSAKFASQLKNAKIRSSIEQFVSIRNHHIGHGAFPPEPSDAVDVVQAAMIPTDSEGGVLRLFGHLGDVEWPLFSVESGSERIALRGAGSISMPFRHRDHRTTTNYAPLSPAWVQFGEETPSDLAPLISARRCSDCGHSGIFLFDSLVDAKTAKADFIDYTEGLKMRASDPGIAAHLNRAAVSAFEESIKSLDGGLSSRPAMAMLEAEAIKNRYVSPVYLRRPLFERIESSEKSITWLQAPAHVGKTVFSQGIALSERGKGDSLPVGLKDMAVASISIKREWRSELSLIRVRLIDTLMEALEINPDVREKLPTLGASLDNPSKQLSRLLEVALSLSGKGTSRRLLVVIDGLDELNPTTEGLRLLDFLPTVAELPSGIHLLLTSRRPGDPDCPAWIDHELESRLFDVSIHRIDPSDNDYLKVLRAYSNKVLDKRRLNESEFKDVLAKSDGLFLYFGFIIDQIAEQQFQVDALGDLPSARDLYSNFALNLKHRIGAKRLAEEAELAFYGLAAEEVAEDWLSGKGLKSSPWRGVPLDELARLNDRDEPGGGIDSLFLYAIGRLKSVIGVDRGGAGTSRYRLWLKGVGELLGDRADTRDRLRQQHESAAIRLLDDGVVSTRVISHVVCSSNRSLMQRAAREKELMLCLLAVSDDLDAQMFYPAAIGAVDLALEFLDSLGTRSDFETRYMKNEMLAKGHLKRGVSKSEAFGERAGKADYTTAIRLWEKCRRWNSKGKGSWSEDPEIGLMKAYMCRAIVHEDASRMKEATKDYNTAIALGEASRRKLMRRKTWLPEHTYALAKAYNNRGYMASGSRHKADLGFCRKAISTLGAITRNRRLSNVDRKNVENLHANALLTYANAVSESKDDRRALPIFDRTIEAFESLRRSYRRRPAEWPLEYRVDYAKAYANRAMALNNLEKFESEIADRTKCIDALEEFMRSLRSKGQTYAAKHSEALYEAYVCRSLARLQCEFGRGAIDDSRRAVALEGEVTNAETTGFIENRLKIALGLHARAERARSQKFKTASTDDEAAAEMILNLPGMVEGNELDPEHAEKLAQVYVDGALHGFISEQSVDLAFVRKILGHSPNRGDKRSFILWQSLATAYFNRASDAEDSGNLSRAFEDYGVAISTLETARAEFVEAGWGVKDECSLMNCLVNRGTNLFRRGDFAGAKNDYGRAVVAGEEIRSMFLAKKQRWPAILKNDLVRAKLNFAEAHCKAIGNVVEVITHYSEATTLRRGLRARVGKFEWNTLSEWPDLQAAVRAHRRMGLPRKNQARDAKLNQSLG